MKTQIIKIIPCLLAGFILSACVGAVNIPSEVAEKVIKTTDPDPVVEKTAVVIIDDKDPEPIVVDPEVALINRCIIGDNLKDSSCAPIVSEHPCIRDPFGVACDITFADYYKTAQANRISFCRENYDSNFCKSARDDIKNICLADPFDSFCFFLSASSYNNARETTCAGEKDSPRCETTISRVCSTDSFNALCVGNETYYPAQKRVCESEPNSERCRLTLARVCTDDIFNPYCVNAEAYHPARMTACESEPTSARCRPTIERVCPETPFNTLCQSVNLTLSDLPASNHILRSGNLKEGTCLWDDFRPFHICYGVILPDVINITPLNDTNTGTATYTGVLSVYGERGYNFDDRNIDLIVNFKDKTIITSGNLYRLPSDFVASFSINGSFTDRGQITGTFTLQRYGIESALEAELIGLIGQEEIFGGFANGESLPPRFSCRTDYRCGNKFAGGFTATRQPQQ